MRELDYELFSIENCLNLYRKGIICECDADNKNIIFKEE